VLGDPAALRRLEAIVHPAVASERAAFLASHAAAPLVVLDVPLLFETGGERYCNRVAVVSAGEAVQRARVLARPGMTAAKLDAILARQLPDAEKRARADIVIPTGGALEKTRVAVRQAITCLIDPEAR
jgi:dephospho-CoA kinase